MNENKGIMPSKVELALEQSQHDVSDDALNIRVILFSIHSDDGNPSSVNIKQHCARKIVTIRFTLTVLSALRRSDNENRLMPSPSLYEPVRKQLAIKVWDEYAFVIRPYLVGVTFKSVRTDL
ncbi:hypothetical protein Tco_0879683 [Tanacetum coccineum]